MEEKSILCFGDSSGILNATVVGGTPYFNEKYKYRWFYYRMQKWIPLNVNQRILENCPSGYYQVEVQDSGGAFARSHYWLDEPKKLQQNLSFQNETCPGACNGKASLHIDGGIMPYSILWDDSFTGDSVSFLCQGIHSVAFNDANQCYGETINFAIDGYSSKPRLKVEVKNAYTPGGNEGELCIRPMGGKLPYRLLIEKEGALIHQIERNNENEFCQTKRSAGSYRIVLLDSLASASPLMEICSVDTTVLIAAPDTLMVQLVLENEIRCYGDNSASLRAMVSGGTDKNGYNYTWYSGSNNIPVLLQGETDSVLHNCPAGQYWVKVSDQNQITATDTFTIHQPEALEVMPLVEAVRCFGEADGVASLRISGGTPPYRCLWNNGFVGMQRTKLLAGFYGGTVVDAVGCARPFELEVPHPAQPLTIVLDSVQWASNPQQSNGWAKVKVQGGWPPYQVEWYENEGLLATGNLLTNVPQGNYRAQVSDAKGCLVDLMVNIEAYESLHAELSCSTPLVCYGDDGANLVAQVDGGCTLAPYAYRWFCFKDDDWQELSSTTSILQNAEAGRYRLRVSDNSGNNTVAEYVLEAPTQLVLSASITPVACKGDENGGIEVLAEGGRAPYAFQWNNGDRTNRLHQLKAADYEVTVIDANGCKVQGKYRIDEPDRELQVSLKSFQPPSSEFGFDGVAELNITGGYGNYRVNWLNRPNLASHTFVDGLGVGNYAVEVFDSLPGSSVTCNALLEFILEANPPLVAELNIKKKIACFNQKTGALRVSISGGKPNALGKYSIQWFQKKEDEWMLRDETTEMISQLGAAEYRVVVSDELLNTLTIDTVLVEPQPLILWLDATNAGCGADALGQITATPSGGTPPYNYQWSPDSNNQSTLNDAEAGVYTVQVSDQHDCNISGSATIVQSGELQKNPVVEPALCLQNCRGEITLNIQGGSGSYRYQWNDPSLSGDHPSGLCSGTYSVYVSDEKSNCHTTASFFIPEPLPPSALERIKVPPTLCANQSYLLDATIDGAEYLWEGNNGFVSRDSRVDLHQAGEYRLSVLDSNQCNWVKTFQLAKTDFDIGAEFLVATQIQPGDTLIVVNTSYPEADEMEWELPRNTQVLQEQNNLLEVVFPVAGEFNVGLWVSKGECSEYFSKAVSVSEIHAPTYAVDKSLNPLIEQVKVIPNPATDRFGVEVRLSREAPVQLTLIRYNTSHVVQKQKTEVANWHQFHFADGLPAGTYVVNIRSGSETKNVKVLVF